MRVAVYARVSTSDKEQDPETQLMPLRDFCIAQGYEVQTSISTTPLLMIRPTAPSGEGSWTMRPNEGSRWSWSSSWIGPSEA